MLELLIEYGVKFDEDTVSYFSMEELQKGVMVVGPFLSKHLEKIK
jgi:hypothetical protein